MPETAYEYTISVDFPNDQVDPGKLTREIEASSIVTPLARIETVAPPVDLCRVIFSDALSAAEKTTLDGDASPAAGLIGAHDGIRVDSVPAVAVRATGASPPSTGAPVTVPLDASLPPIDPLEERRLYDLAGDVVTILRPGLYFITAGATIEVSAVGLAVTTVETWIELDQGGGFVAMVGSRSRDSVGGLVAIEACATFASVVRFLAAGDKLRMRMNRISGSATVTTRAQQARLAILWLRE